MSKEQQSFLKNNCETYGHFSNKMNSQEPGRTDLYFQRTNFLT